MVVRIEPGTSNNPSPRPWHLVNWGMTFDAPEDAVNHAINRWDAPEPERNGTYARQEALMAGLGLFEAP